VLISIHSNRLVLTAIFLKILPFEIRNMLQFIWLGFFVLGFLFALIRLIFGHELQVFNELSPAYGFVLPCIGHLNKRYKSLCVFFK
jgi:hypothetical protein